MASIIYSPIVDAIRGKAGSAVFVQGRTGPVLKPRVKPANPKTAAQQAVKGYLGNSSKGYKNLTTANVALWKAYGQSVTKHNQRTGKAYTQTGINAFNSISAKFYQINPTGNFPATPPAAAFTGDTITVTAAGGASSVIFTGSAADSANIRTEFLLQPLKSKNRTPASKGYKSKGFIAFAAGALSATTFVPSGWYVPAYRFVNALTGQATALTILAPVQAT